jgi:nickel-type superoxide dismutase maturation protease
VSGRLALAAAVLGGVAAILLALRRAVDVVEVRGGSMAPALLAGDRLLVESVTYRRRRPRPGEVVLARDPRSPQRELIKRIAAVDPVAASVILAGDAPDASTDSRAFGPVPLNLVRWRAVGRYWPPRRRP